MRSSHSLWGQEGLKGLEGLVAKGMKVSGSDQRKRGEVMFTGLTPETTGEAKASLLHTAVSTPLGWLLGSSRTIRYQHITAVDGRVSAWVLSTSSALGPRHPRLH